MTQGWLRVSKVAKHFDYSLAHIYDLVRQGELEAIKKGGTMRISASSLEAFEDRHRVKTSEGE